MTIPPGSQVSMEGWGIMLIMVREGSNTKERETSPTISITSCLQPHFASSHSLSIGRFWFWKIVSICLNIVPQFKYILVELNKIKTILSFWHSALKSSRKPGLYERVRDYGNSGGWVREGSQHQGKSDNQHSMAHKLTKIITWWVGGNYHHMTDSGNFVSFFPFKFSNTNNNKKAN